MSICTSVPYYALDPSSANRCRGNDSDSGLLSSSFNCSWIFIIRAYTRRDIVLTHISCVPVVSIHSLKTNTFTGEIQRKHGKGHFRLSRLSLFTLNSRSLFILILISCKTYRYITLIHFVLVCPIILRKTKNSIGRGCRFLFSRAWAAQLVYGSALFSNITSTGSEGRRRETPSDHARLNFRVGGNRRAAGAEDDGYGGEEGRRVGG